LKTIKNAHGDIIRDIRRFTEVGFVSCSNDESIKLWTTLGDQISALSGHSSFVFTVESSANGEVFSGSEDKTLKIWKNEHCIQTITHPSTVWVTRVDEDGNLVSACGDGFTRVFSTDKNKIASEEEVTQFERESEMAAAQGPEGLSEAELAKLPSVDALKRVTGKRDGEIRIFKNGTTPEAYVWKEESKSWDKIGEVLGNKQTHFYEGDRFFPAGEYDYIFEIDDESGISKKIPFNNGDNPLESAEKFIAREGMSRGYLEQITNFIRQNTRHAQG
jgi:phospholipase A-2-activating protein